jgi:hypothetical protein
VSTATPIEIAEDIAKEAAAYVAETQPLLDKQAAAQQAWNEQAMKTAAVLAHRGLITQNKVNAFADKLAEDPRCALTFLEKLARSVGPDDLGTPSEKTAAVVDGNMDPFVREFCPELAARGGNGLVD